MGGDAFSAAVEVGGLVVSSVTRDPVISSLYLGVFHKYSSVCGFRDGDRRVTSVRVVDRDEDSQFYLNIYKHYSRFCTGKQPMVFGSSYTDAFGNHRGSWFSYANSHYQGCYSQSHDPFQRYMDIRERHAALSAETVSACVAAHLRSPGVSVPCAEFALHSNPGCSASNTPSVNRRSRTQRVASSSHTGVMHMYLDLGDCNQECQHCGAGFWYDEHLKGHSQTERPQYHLCCGGGQIYMEPEEDPPDYIKNLLQSRSFMENIRAYNQMFAMTSFGAKIDESINAGRGPYVFKVSGQIYHWIGSMCPAVGEPPRFLQLYIYDTEHEVENRMRHFGGMDDSGLDTGLVEGLMHFLDAHNQLIQLFRSARDKCSQLDIPEFKIRLYNAEGARGYELPTSNVLGAMVFESGCVQNKEFDVIIERKHGPPQRINKLHKSYMSLQFPLLFIYGQPGYHVDLKLGRADGHGKVRRVTMLAYYRYQLHFRLKQYDLIFRTGRLFQQFVVGAFVATEQNRLDFIRKHQSDIRSDYFSGLYYAISRGERDGYEVGGMVILPMSFTGGPRYMYAHYLDALAICRKLGNPSYFITFTCNVNWPEIQRFMQDYPLLTPADRADVVCRVFEQKIHAFVNFLKQNQPFGKVIGGIVVETINDTCRDSLLRILGPLLRLEIVINLT